MSDRAGILLAMTELIAIGTKKGLFLAKSKDDRRSWQLSSAHFPGMSIYAVAIDNRGPRPRLLVPVMRRPMPNRIRISPA